MIEEFTTVSIAEPIDVKSLLDGEDASHEALIEPLEAAINGPQVAEVRREVAAMQSEVDSGKASEGRRVKAGVTAYILGQHSKAARYLAQAPDNGVACFYRALALRALNKPEEAEEQFDAAGKNGFDKVECTLRKAGAIRAQGRLDEAEKTIRSIAKEAASRAEYSYQMGCILADRGDIYGAIEYFERAADMDPHHSRALFRLAAENARCGNDDEAVRLYEQSLSRPPYYLGAMLNLGLLYEDRENYSAAAYCFNRVLEYEPNHERARLYLKDIEATSDMYYDEESARHETRMKQLLSRPVSDFELSVRSRNCLQQMNIYTLNDLTEISEQDLLAGKNFGETSLQEIREIMDQHNLVIGQNLHQDRASEPAFKQTDLSPQEQALMGTSIAELNLSVRARKCMTRLGIATLGDLVQKTPDELLSSRNFGVTSLNEVRQKLGEINVKLRND